MDPSQRSRQLKELGRRIQEEEARFQRDLEAGKIPEDLIRYNALYHYHRVFPRRQGLRVIGYFLLKNPWKIKRETAKCGFFGSLMFHQDKTAKEATLGRTKREEFERILDSIKDQKAVGPLYSVREVQDGLSFLSFLGLIVFSRLSKAWQASPEMQNSYSQALDLLDEMESIRYSQTLDGTTRITAFTEEQVQIAKACSVAILPLFPEAPKGRKVQAGSRKPAVKALKRNMLNQIKEGQDFH